MDTMTETGPLPQGRVVSLDLVRGLVMVLLLGNGAGLYRSFAGLTDPDSLPGMIALQFRHHPWNGLRFWDLVQPYFMFIVGVAMWFSVQKRLGRGDSWSQVFRHIVQRCLILLVLALMLHSGYAGKPVWELWNVLAQLSFTILVAFLIMHLSVRIQLSVSFGLILLTELLYRFTGIAGYDQPFVKDQNFGSFMDLVLMGKVNDGGGWVAINCIPTAAHTIWGVVAGKLLASGLGAREKVKRLATVGAAGLLVGYSLDLVGLVPIIKRICTSSFVITSGGWCLVTLAFFYWLIDFKGVKNWTLFFAIVGMNSIFIYTFMETVGKQWFREFMAIFVLGFLGRFSVSEEPALFVNSIIVLGLAWGLCFWLYRNRIFIKV